MSSSRDRTRRKSVERLTGFQVGFHILLALADGPAHGAAITRQIVGDTLGLHIGGATLYDELGRLGQAGLIERTSEGRSPKWRLTDEGARQLELQVRQLKRVGELAVRRGLLNTVR